MPEPSATTPSAHPPRDVAPPCPVLARPASAGPWSPFADWVARLDHWRTNGRLGKALVVVLVVAAGLVAYGVGVSGDRGVDARPPSTLEPHSPDAATPAVGSGGAAKVATVILVHVAGAVVHPGVVELQAGARVIDAVERAGGALPAADLDRLNLAAKIADGERILVQKIGDPGAPADPIAGPAAGTTSAGLVNLNTATAAQLDTLPGIGPTLAAAILAERQRRGTFRSVNELRDVRGIGEKRFADLRDRVTV